jgi:PKD repeat protein
MYISGDGGCIDSASTVITVRPSVKAGFKIDNAIQCFKNNRFIFTDTSRTTNGAGTIHYLWDFGDGNSSNQQSPAHSYTTPGTYSVTLHTDIGGSCSDQVSYNVTVNSTPVAGFNINKQNQCYKGNQYIFNNTSTVFSGSISYYWDLGDGITSTDPDVTHSYGRAGTFTVKMKVVTPEGCADSISINVTVYPNPKADFSVKNICTNLMVPVLNATINNTTSTLNYLWDFGNGVTSTAYAPNYSYPAPGNYTIMLQVSSAQCPTPTDTATHSLVVDAPVPGITYPVIDAVILFPEPLQARDIGSSVLWTPATSLDNSRSYKPHFEGRDPVLYKIELTTPSGCVTVDTQYVKTHKKIEIYVPTGFMPGGTNVYLRPICMGIAKVNYFRIYDRWGKLLFQMASDRPGWNGRIGNQQQELQSVVWTIEAIDVDGNIHHRSGTTVLLH